MIRVYILGESRGVYRVQSLIKLIVDNRKKYKIYYDSIFYCSCLLRYLKSIFINPFVILRSNVVYVCTLNVDLNIFYELFWAKLLRKKIIVDFYVSVYDTVVLDRKWFKEGSFLAKLAIICDKLFLKMGNELLFLTDTERKHYLSLAGVSEQNIRWRIVPIGVEERIKTNASFVKGEKETLNVCWWGTYIPLHGLDVLMKAAQILKKENLPIRWYFFGNDPKKGKTYLQMIQDLGIEDICFLSDEYTFSNGRLQQFLEENCDIALGPFGSSLKSRKVLSNKYLEACSMKCCVLTGQSEAVDEYFGKEKKSVFLSERTPQAVAEKILEIYHMDRDEIMERIENTYKIFQDNFTIGKLTDRMEEVLDDIMSPHTRGG